MTDPAPLTLSFPETDPATAGQLANDLQNALSDALKDHGAKAEISLERENDKAQDLGTILAIVLGAKATIALAAGIAGWMQRRNQSKIVVTFPDGRTAEVTNAESEHIEGILRAAATPV